MYEHVFSIDEFKDSIKEKPSAKAWKICLPVATEVSESDIKRVLEDSSLEGFIKRREMMTVGDGWHHPKIMFVVSGLKSTDPEVPPTNNLEKPWSIERWRKGVNSRYPHMLAVLRKGNVSPAEVAKQYGVSKKLVYHLRKKDAAG